MPSLMDSALYPDATVASIVIQEYVLVNNDDWTDKLNQLVQLVKRVYSLASPPSTPGSCMEVSFIPSPLALEQKKYQTQREISIKICGYVHVHVLH
tara:strand:- start:242 stop:529 length:288 start_codon:yes stop_codon:yes gene_type:complete